MIAITHLVVSLLLIQLLNLDRNDAFVALMFGVLIDLDHLMGLGNYAKANGISALFDLDHLTNPGGHWKSLFHNPVSVAVIAPLSIASKLAIPLLFWGVHMAMDFVQESYLGVLSAPEAVFLCLATLSLVTIRYSSYLRSGSQGTMWQYFGFEIKNIREAFSFRTSPAI
jgi:hypothetical protein